MTDDGATDMPPAVGGRSFKGARGRLAERMFSYFEGFVRPLDMPVHPMPAHGPVRLVLHFATMFRTLLAIVGVLAVLSALADLLLVWGIAWIVDGVTTLGVSNFLDANAWRLAILIGLLAILEPIITLVRSAFLSISAAVGLPNAIHWQSHKTVERQDMAFFEDTFAGQVASRIGQVTGMVQTQMLVAIQDVPMFAIQMLGSIALLAALAWPLALPVAAWVTLNAIVAWWAVPRFLRVSEAVAEAEARTGGAMTDVYSNIETVKLFGAEDTEASAMRATMQDMIAAEQRERRVIVGAGAATHLANVSLWLALLGVGIWGMSAGTITVGEFVASLAMARTLTASAERFMQLGQLFSSGLGMIRDAMPVLTTPRKIVDAPGAKTLQLDEGVRPKPQRLEGPDGSSTTTSEVTGTFPRVEFDRVSFSYREGTAVIRDLSLAIEQGERIGLVGPSGAGKSTLVRLLLRLREVDEGAVRIDGHDVREVTQASLRQAIGVVTQDVALLHRSVRDNVRYSRPDATDEEVLSALRAAEADCFVRDLKDGKDRTGLDAYTGDRGVKLSGGQRQRIAVARAVLKNAPILVLDEATSALDSETEAAIQSSLRNVMIGKTVIAIAHRLSTIAAMDRLVVMEGGRITESGTHAELIERNGTYARLWKRQSGGFLRVDAVDETATLAA